MTAVEAVDVTKRFGATVALTRAGIRIAPGRTHALVGRNGAGKSTMVSILTGLARPDEGTVSFGGEPAPPLGDRDGWRRRVACVYQRSTIIPSLSVAENLFLNRQSDGGPIRWRGLRRRSQEILERYGVAVRADRLAGELTVEQRQLVEIARALSAGARFIILDEPTAQLDGPAIQRLFTRMRALKEQGVTMLFISHHLNEVYEVCDDVTVFRDARHVLTTPVAELPHGDLVAAMTGDAVTLGERSDRAAPAPEIVLRTDELSLRGHYEDVSLEIHRGEVLGLAGSGSSGKVALAETLAGLRGAGRGMVSIDGVRLRPGDVAASVEAGLGFVPEDRNKEGFVPLLSLAENVTLPVTRRLGRYGAVSAARQRAYASRMIGELDIRASGPEQPVGELSGGNAQKAVMARALSNEPKALVVVDPTAGVDVRAKEALLGAIEDAARLGSGVLVVSDDLDDLRVCDRVLVMFHGRVVRDLPRGWTDQELVALMEGVA
ncbi:sugar ABC transporter ATP-binding protein [Planotetraspora sp. GP83]|uniref:sugar ABC transporter ATP-binding protein n=1 Tax=Planotetraspora sp. GP83 TaxID=3156264 RepID=UPI0035172C1B